MNLAPALPEWAGFGRDSTGLSWLSRARSAHPAPHTLDGRRTCTSRHRAGQPSCARSVLRECRQHAPPTRRARRGRRRARCRSPNRTSKLGPLHAGPSRRVPADLPGIPLWALSAEGAKEASPPSTRLIGKAHLASREAHRSRWASLVWPVTGGVRTPALAAGASVYAARMCRASRRLAVTELEALTGKKVS
jgi:hypothetical protein